MENNNRNAIEKVLTKLGIEQPNVISDILRIENLIEFEKRHALSFPNEYKEFILSFDEIFFENEIEFKPIKPSPLTTHEGKQYFDSFYGLNSLSEQIECYESRIPNCLIPIGECPGGNLICLGVKEVALGKIYFWNHENELRAKLLVGEDEPINDINLYWNNLHLVADTFMDFLNKLKINQDNVVDGDIDVEDVELWLDDDLIDN